MTRPGPFFSTLALVACLAAGGCKKEEAAAPPSGIPPMPAQPGNPHELAPAAEGQVNPHAAGGLPPGHPAVSPTGAPAGEMPNVHGEEGFDPKQRVTGTIAVDDKVKGSVTPGEVIYVVARVDDGSERGGIILGVKRLTAGTFPAPFELDGRDAMAPGTKLQGKVVITARADKDGDAMTRDPGDVLGVLHLTVPADGVKLVLDTLMK